MIQRSKRLPPPRVFPRKHTGQAPWPSTVGAPGGSTWPRVPPNQRHHWVARSRLPMLKDTLAEARRGCEPTTRHSLHELRPSLALCGIPPCNAPGHPHHCIWSEGREAPPMSSVVCVSSAHATTGNLLQNVRLGYVVARCRALATRICCRAPATSTSCCDRLPMSSVLSRRTRDRAPQLVQRRHWGAARRPGGGQAATGRRWGAAHMPARLGNDLWALSQGVTEDRGANLGGRATRRAAPRAARTGARSWATFGLAVALSVRKLIWGVPYRLLTKNAPSDHKSPNSDIKIGASFRATLAPKIWALPRRPPKPTSTNSGPELDPDFRRNVTKFGVHREKNNKTCPQVV